jgi:hypothetical protein
MIAASRMGQGADPAAVGPLSLRRPYPPELSAWTARDQTPAGWRARRWRPTSSRPISRPIKSGGAGRSERLCRNRRTTLHRRKQPLSAGAAFSGFARRAAGHPLKVETRVRTPLGLQGRREGEDSRRASGVGRPAGYHRPWVARHPRGRVSPRPPRRRDRSPRPGSGQGGAGHERPPGLVFERMA